MLDCIDHAKVGDKDGYLGVTHKGRFTRAHRVAYCFARGIPIHYIQGYVIRHTCDNPRCINPEHLLLGTHQDNMDDKVARGRQAKLKGVVNGRAKLTEKDVEFIRKHYKPRCPEYGANVLAKRFAVSFGLISKIGNGRRWT